VMQNLFPSLSDIFASPQVWFHVVSKTYLIKRRQVHLFFLINPQLRFSFPPRDFRTACFLSYRYMEEWIPFSPLSLKINFLSPGRSLLDLSREDVHLQRRTLGAWGGSNVYPSASPSFSFPALHFPPPSSCVRRTKLLLFLWLLPRLEARSDRLFPPSRYI